MKRFTVMFQPAVIEDDIGKRQTFFYNCSGWYVREWQKLGSVAGIAAHSYEIIAGPLEAKAEARLVVELKDKICSKLAAEGLTITSKWSDIEDCLSQVVLSKLCIKVTQKLWEVERIKAIRHDTLNNKGFIPYELQGYSIKILDKGE